MMKNTTSTGIIRQCLDILKRDDIKYELRKMFTPIIHLILYELNPFIYITVLFVFLIFIINLAILVLLILRNKK